ncbi:MAG: DUF456 domain-containing protein [Planctomycetaceae bacterium]|nr:DUF456 domain-containing protein [Planctomycetaceae bacterium]
MAIVIALILVVILIGCWLLNLLGLPGNWLMLVTATIYACLTPSQSPVALGWTTIVALAVLALLGEIIELAAGAMGVAKAGGSRRAALLALIGSIGGAMVGLVVGTPIFLIGPLVAAVLFGGFGAMTGAVLGELWAGRRLDDTWPIAKRAFWGRLAGTLAKILVGTVMLAVVVAALIF